MKRLSQGMHRKILNIALPSIVSNITVPLLGLVDTAIVGHLGAAAYIGAIAVGGMLFNMVYWLFGFLRMGTGGFTAQAYGAGEQVERYRILFRSLGLAGLISFVLILLQSILVEVAFQMMNATPEVEVLARDYYHILIWGAPAVLGLYSFTGWFLGSQNARYPMWVAIVQNVVNIAASLFLVLGCGWKVEGVAWGTLVAQYAGFFMAVGLWWRRYRHTLDRRSLKGIWQRSSMLRFFRVNRDIFLRTLCLVAVTTTFTATGAAQGDVVLAVNALLLQLFVLFSYVMDGFAYAGEALGGQFFGAKDRHQFAELTRVLFRWGWALAGIFTLVYLCFGPVFIRLLTDNEAVAVASSAYLVYAIFVPLAGFAAFLYDGLFIGTTSTKEMLVAMAGAALAFFVIRFALVEVWHNHALWLAFLVYLFLRGAIQRLYYGNIERKL